MAVTKLFSFEARANQLQDANISMLLAFEMYHENSLSQGAYSLMCSIYSDSI